MTKQAQDAVNAITDSKLSDYGVTQPQTETREPATNYTPAPPRKTKTKAKTYTPKPVTSAEDYRRRFPSTSPASLSGPIAERVRKLRDIPHLSTVDAVYTQAEWQTVEDTLRHAMQDIFGAAGFVCKSNAEQQAFFKLMFEHLPQAFKHGDATGLYRQIVVDESQDELDLSIPDFLRRDK
jgi:hypothetical protein